MALDYKGRQAYSPPLPRATPTPQRLMRPCQTLYRELCDFYLLKGLIVPPESK